MKTNEILDNISKKLNLNRCWYNEGDIPTSSSNICIYCVLGDIKSISINSMILCKRFKDEIKSSKYFIVLSWDGMQSLFPYANEFWSLSKKTTESSFNKSNGFLNESPAIVQTIRDLNWYFEDIVNNKEIEEYYKSGIKKSFFEKFKHIKVYKPSISSSSILGNEFNREFSKRENKKIFVYPSKYIKTIQFKEKVNLLVSKDFWVSLCDYLISKDITPVVWICDESYDLSPNFIEKCVYLNTNNIEKVLSLMRICDCTIDIMSGVSKYSLISRSPFICCEDRVVYNEEKDYEINSLCGQGIYFDYFYAFYKNLEDKNKRSWENSIFDVLNNKINNLFTNLNNKDLLSSLENEEIAPYNLVKKLKKLKLGTKFIKVKKEN